MKIQNYSNAQNNRQNFGMVSFENFRSEYPTIRISKYLPDVFSVEGFPDVVGEPNSKKAVATIDAIREAVAATEREKLFDDNAKMVTTPEFAKLRKALHKIVNGAVNLFGKQNVERFNKVIQEANEGNTMALFSRDGDIVLGSELGLKKFEK